jgi:Na+/H+ antiporter NhaD/arsenite permease-like protein
VLLVAIFVVGYLAIVFEHQLGLNKSASALLTGVLCWTVYVFTREPGLVNEQLAHHLGELSQVLFFLLAAMTIVEQIDAHDGFELLTSRVTTTNRRRLLVTIAVFAFFLSAVLDNLTTAILMVSLVRRLVADEEDRMIYGGVVIIAANSGGTWSPIGDVTTTMLWVGNQITSLHTIRALFLPAAISVLAPTLWLALRMKGEVRRPGGRRRAEARTEVAREVLAESAEGASSEAATSSVTLPEDAAAVRRTLLEINLPARTGVSVLAIAHREGEAERPSPVEPLRAGDVLELEGPTEKIGDALDLLFTGEGPRPTTRNEQRLILLVGVGALLFVPVFKTLTHLPPVMGILLGLGGVWLVTEMIHKRKNDERKSALSVAAALQRVDAQSVLFFLGILLAISALQADGLLAALARWMDETVGSVNLITLLIGLSSSVVDNVPLVAAAQGMYSRSVFPTDHRFWTFLAYCAGTGGSILIIGSAAGIAVMGSSRISFGWYLRRLTLPALLGYAAGALTYLALG